MIAPQFPALDQGTYLNTASSGLLSRSLLAWRRQHDLEFLQEGSLFRDHQERNRLLPQCKEALAQFFGGVVENTFLVPNFSYAFNTVLSLLKSPQRFLLLKEEYPSIQYPIASRGMPMEQVLIDEQLEDRILDAFKRFKPTVFAFSLVQYTNGIKMDFEFIRQLKVDYPDVLLLADGTQYCGTALFDFDRSGIDVLIASGYKWMLAGYGNGFMLVQKSALSMLDLPVGRPADRPALSHLQDKSALSFCVEPGHQDTLSFGSLKFAVDFFREIGFERETVRLHQLTQKAKEAFVERGLIDAIVAKRTHHSTIFNLKGGEGLYKRLQSEDIVCIPRGKGIRVGFHFYNGEDDLERLLDVLDTYTRA